MDTLVLDTNLVSYRMKRHSLAESYQPLLDDHLLAISFMTVAELYEGAARAQWGPAKLQLLEDVLSSYQILHSSSTICLHWAQIRWARRPQPISSEDAWIAATARAYGCPLVTHNASDFRDIPDLQILTLSG
jgi:tRNA(fMet)-specific endonuclease VapC